MKKSKNHRWQFAPYLHTSKSHPPSFPRGVTLPPLTPHSRSSSVVFRLQLRDHKEKRGAGAGRKGTLSPGETQGLVASIQAKGRNLKQI